MFDFEPATTTRPRPWITRPRPFSRPFRSQQSWLS